MSLENGSGVRGHRDTDEALLDDPTRIAQADPGQMLPATAAGGPQVREAMALAAEADLGSIADEGRPRAVVVAGAGTAATTGDILEAVAGPRCPVPVVAHRSAGVPGWVGAADLVIAVSASGRSPEALGAADAAARRGARLVAIGPADSELQAVAARGRAPYIPVPRRAPARASLWALTVPVLLAAKAVGLVRLAEADLVETATRLDTEAERCRTTAESFTNPAKALALELAGSVPVIWGSTPLAAVAARRFADLLSATARYPAVADSLLEAGRGPVGLLDGPYGALAESERDIFSDEQPDTFGGRLRLVILRDDGFEQGTPAEENDGEEPPAVEIRRAKAVQQLAERRGVRCTVLRAEGASPLERFASLTAVPDFASVYLALAHGFDPMAVPAVSEMKDFVTP
jgi:glucose/mannose-6-phosphate isomerase